MTPWDQGLHLNNHNGALAEHTEFARLGKRFPFFAWIVVILGTPMWIWVWDVESTRATAIGLIPWGIGFLLLACGLVFIILGWRDAAKYGKPVIRHAFAATLTEILVGGSLVLLFCWLWSLRGHFIDTFW